MELVAYLQTYTCNLEHVATFGEASGLIRTICSPTPQHLDKVDAVNGYCIADLEVASVRPNQEHDPEDDLPPHG